VLRTLAVGADFCFAGRAFLLAVAAIGEAGGAHAAASFIEEIRGNFGQAGIRSVEEARAAAVLHPNAVNFETAANAAGLEAPRRRVG
jgi:L-lactate dehydrogenase (cytochrome)